MNLNKKMKKFNDNLSSSSRTNSNKKIMIKTLNFDKLPKNFNSTNYNANTFLNVTKSKTHRSNNNHLPSSSSKIHSKPCLIKPISTRNKNTITLNLVPKVSNHISNSVHHHTMKQIRPISRNKIQTNHNNNKHNLFSNGLYASYNNSSATYKSYKNTFNHNASSLNNLNSFTKISISKSSSRNKNFTNTSNYSIIVNSRDSINITFNSLGKKGKKLYFGNNSILKNSINGGNIINTTVKYNSMSFNKLGGRFKRKSLLKKEEENMILREKIEKLRDIDFMNNFMCFKIFKLWRAFKNKKKKENIIYILNKFLNKKIINEYQNKLIRRYNIISGCENIYNFDSNKNIIEINDLNYENILINEYHIIEKVIQTIENNSIANNRILTSASFNCLNRIFKKLLEKSKNFVFKNEYIYNNKKNKLEIISKLNNQEVIKLLNKIISYINKNNFKSLSSKKYIIQFNTYIENLKDNEKKVEPILNEYIDFYKENENRDDLKESFTYKNINNDFSLLKSSKYNNIILLIFESIKEIKELIEKNHQEKEENYILIYKLQNLKYMIFQKENQLNKIKKIQKDINDENFKNIIEILEKTKKDLNNESEFIKLKYPIETLSKDIDNCKINLNEIIPLIEIIFVKYNILYNNFDEITPHLSTYFENFKNKKLIKLFKLYNEALLNSSYINVDLIHFNILLSKFERIINKLENNDDKNCLDYFNLLILYKEEMERLYENNKKDNNFKNAYNDLLIIEKKLNNKKDLLLSICKNSTVLPKPEILNGKNSEELYLKIISNKLKFENKNEIPFELEHTLFKELKIKSNNKLSKEEENKFINEIKLYEKNTNDEQLEKIKNEIDKKYIEKNIKNKELISVFPYPKIYLLPDNILNEISLIIKISINDIKKYFNKINPNQEIIISENLNNITGIRINSSNSSENEIFKFSNPITIPQYVNNKNPLNNIHYLSTIYCNIESSISNSLTTQLLNSLSNFSKKSFHNWINITYSQISICTLCLIFTNEISNLLSEQNKKAPLREFNLISQKYQQWIKDESNQINGNIIRVNIILTLLSQLNIIEFLIKNEISDINSFNWLKFIRHLWDKNKKDVIIECGGWANYQLKQLNPFHYKILLTPDTDKIFLFNSSCFREKSASIIKVINNRYCNNSYKDIFEEFCNLFWTNMIEINSITSNFNEIKNIFDISTITKSWIYMDNLDFLNKNSNTNINNLIYLSKFMQTVQQEVILNDIKYNDGEKMFCLMSCIEIDNDVKLKEEYLKGSSRVLNFVKPDINYYLLQCVRIINKNNNKDNCKNLIPIINQYESKIRNSLTKFYFDYDFYNDLINKLIIKYIANNTEGNDNVQNIVNEYIFKYSKRFYLSKEKDSSNIEKEISDFLHNENILFEKEHISLFKFLFNVSSNITLPIVILINGFGKHFIIQKFSKFYKSKFNNEFKNDNIIILYKEPEFEYFTISQTFHLPIPKNKKLLKYFLNNIFFKFTEFNISLSDELRLTLIEYIHEIIKLNSDKIQYYISACNFNKWLNIFIDFISVNKIIIKSINVFDIITQAILITFEYKKDIKKNLIIKAKNIINSSIINEFSKQNNNFSYFDIQYLIYREFNNYLEYINQYIKYLYKISNNQKEKIITFLSEDFENENKYENIYIENPILDQNFTNEEIYKIHNIKIFIGYNISDRIINMNMLKNEMIKDFIKNIKDEYNKNQFIYFISQLYDYNFNNDELNYIYRIFNRKHHPKNEINYNNISNIQIILKYIYKFYPKENYCIISGNKLIKYLCKYELFPNSNITFNDNKKNSFYFDMDTKEFCIKFIYQLLFHFFKSKIIEKKLSSINEIVISNEEINTISNMIYDFYKIESEFKFSEKYPNNTQYISMFKNIFELLQIEYNNQNISFYTISLINYIKNKKNPQRKTNYQSYSSLSNIFSNNPNKLKELTMIIDNTLTNYKNLISDQNEFINSKYFYIKFINNIKQSKDILNEVLEEVHLSLSNHFLFSLLVTFELMINSFEISHIEMNYILNYMKEYYIFPNENIIKFKYENDFDKMKFSFFQSNGKKLVDFYTKTTKSINNAYLQLLNKSLDKSNNKYFYTSNIKKINRDVDKLLYYITFLPDQSSSIFKYLINKYLINMYNFGKYNVNSFLKKNHLKNTIIPITIKASPSINVTNFLCSLSAYYEINFYIVRNCNFLNNQEIRNFNFKYLIDSDLINLIKKGMNRGYWIFICDIVNILEFMKIIWEIYENSNKKIHNNFKLFFDQKLILSECKKYVEDMTIMLNIDNENVDDLEAAHDIWVNVLEEKILTDSIMNETQKDILEIIENTTPNEKTGMNDVTINNNKSFNTNNSIVSIKSIYNSITTTMNNNNFNNSNLSDWNFLKNI